MATTINFQPFLKDALVIAMPLQTNDFEVLYNAASDPLIWEQHPNKNRYQRAEFENYFKGAIESGGAFIVKDAVTNEVIGSSRFSDYDAATNTVAIGYTFFIRSHWGTGHNYALKKLMLQYIFQFVDTVNFYIGAVNKRSQTSLERFGAIKTGEKEMAYYGEAAKLDYIYTITRAQWLQLNK
ncbi:GNAT family N-acetyltransferase [Ferruginibacter sp. SUN106]|uniref:GNAT family N-acetyltransferase n=1 Tax=Ferruginibacter sp. SUN106 TaxID=2978348 RepID=UPI003D36AE1E